MENQITKRSRPTEPTSRLPIPSAIQIVALKPSTCLSRYLSTRQLSPSSSLPSFVYPWLLNRRFGQPYICLNAGIMQSDLSHKRTVTSLAFSPDQGEFLLAANMDQVSLYLFDQFRLDLAKNDDCSDAFLSPELTFEFNQFQVHSAWWNPFVPTAFACSFTTQNQIGLCRDIESGHKDMVPFLPGRVSSGCFLTANLLVVGTETGELCGLDLRLAKPACCFESSYSSTNMKPSVVSIFPSSHSPQDSFCAAFSNGHIKEFCIAEGVKRQQAFSSTKRNLPYCAREQRSFRSNSGGIVAIAHGSETCCGVLQSDGSISRFDPTSFRSVGTFRNSFTPASQDIFVTHSKTSGVGLLNRKSEQLFCAVRKYEEHVVDVFDLTMTSPPLWNQNAKHCVASFTFPRNIRAVAIHPEGDFLVCSLMRDSFLHVRGIL